MRFSYRTHPVLKMLATQNPELCRIHPLDLRDLHPSQKTIITSLGLLLKEVSNNITHVSATFLNEAAKYQVKMATSNLLVEIESTSYCFLVNKGGALCMTVSNYPEKQQFLCIGYLIIGDYLLGTFDIHCDYRNPESGLYRHDSKIWLGEGLSRLSQSEFRESIISLLISTVFAKYAKVEIKNLPPNKVVKDFGVKYSNGTDLNIRHFDSKWFTTLVKSDAFKVRGHFRLQPKKVNGVWSKELIWIQDFEKTGYTAVARKLK